MAKDKMPDLKNSQPPRMLGVKKFTEDSNMEPPPFQAWRHEGFVVVYPEGAPGCMAASLDGETFLQRVGPPAMMFAMIDALYGIKLKGGRLFPATYRSLSDDEFLNKEWRRWPLIWLCTKLAKMTKKCMKIFTRRRGKMF
jgi:hypothetical protein